MFKTLNFSLKVIDSVPNHLAFKIPSLEFQTPATEKMRSVK